MEALRARRRRLLSESEKRAYVLRQEEGMKPVSAFCRDEGIALSSFQSWKRMFAEKPAFVEVVTPLEASPVPVEVVLASGSRVVTSSACDPSWLSKLVRSLGTPSC
jgi:hypothetical protein